MNILFFNYSQKIGGGEVWIVNASQKLAKIGHKVFFAITSNGWIHQQNLHLNFPSIDCSALFDSSQSKRFSKQMIQFIQSHQIDLIHSTILGGFTEADWLYNVTEEANRGVVILETGLPPWATLTPWHFGYQKHKRIKVITTVCHYIKRSIIEQFKEIDPNKIEVLYRGVDLSQFNPQLCDGMSLRQEFVLGSRPVLAAIGLLVPKKGFDQLIMAASLLIDDHPDLILLIVGEGPERERLQSLTQLLSIENNVIFTGVREDIPSLLSAIDLLVHPSFHEGLPNVVMEAMAMGKPIIATNVCGVPEIVVDGDTGVLVNPYRPSEIAGAIHFLFRDAEKYQRMGKSSLERIQTHFDRDQKILEFESLARRIVAEAF